jgi:hypothetical protein
MKSNTDSTDIFGTSAKTKDMEDLRFVCFLYPWVLTKFVEKSVESVESVEIET